MRVQLAVLTACVLALAALPASGGEKDKLPVREVDLKGIDLGDAKGDPHKPAVITSAEDLAKAIPSEEAQAKIKKDVDFAKEKVLYFAWSGSGGDSLSFQVDKGEKGPVVTFMYKRGLTRDVRGHHALYAMPRDATWAMGKKQ